MGDHENTSNTHNITMEALLVSALVAAPGYAAPDLAEPPVYTYQYGVNDDYSGANFQQTESRDGYATSGSYTVALPDGRVQTVNYADNGDGIVQDVTYEGVPQYGPAVVKTAVVAHPVAHAVAHPAVVAHPVAHAVAHPVAVAHPAVVAHPVAHHGVVGHGLAYLG